MSLQIFTKPKCQESRKAERYFKERRIPYQLCDLSRRALEGGLAHDDLLEVLKVAAPDVADKARDRRLRKAEGARELADGGEEKPLRVVGNVVQDERVRARELLGHPGKPKLHGPFLPFHETLFPP